MKKNHYQALLTVMLLIIILGFPLFSILIPDRKYSKAERRVLDTSPTFNLETWKDGSFGSNMESYLTDQFPGRDTLVYGNGLINRFLGNNLSQGVYNGKNGFLIQAFHIEDSTLSTKSTKAIQSFLAENNYANGYILLAPTASEILKDKLPKGAPVDSQEKWFEENTSQVSGENVTVVNLFEPFQSSEKDTLFYKTDHHWTTQGAYIGYQSLISAMFPDAEPIQWEEKEICTNFQGTLMSKSGYYSGKKDTISIYTLKNMDVNYIVDYVESQQKTATVYSSEGLEGDDPYEVFFGGNHSHIKITTDQKTDRKLIVFKDSYANSLIPFLIPYFSEIDVIDPRYYAGSVSQLMANSSYTDILFLYNIETYCEDNSLVQILSMEEE
ncbi:hypothetical protein M2454_000843 [Aequitasia blattaphilus]|uniref:DHHW family protein n=1 Tax=Aequitasia blattaphilus TaxID=2949332 RepID=A0ABT1E9Q1_9FIRM|nr:DHHW family protein [Aequitasia blattaphilus]MCP1102548.1 DHHW family protein [Aequitasia blattaphilus]MCR8615188.1 DHHW family protein [Aequitasia blattaphilus]